MEAFDSEIREAYKIHASPGSACLDAEVLEAFYTDRLPATRMEEVRSHIVSCPNCLEFARDSCVFLGILPALDAPISIESVASRRFSRPLLQLAAGLFLVVSVGVVWTNVSRLRQSSDRIPSVRSADHVAELRLIFPKGRLQQPPTRLEWEAARSADYYEVEIQDARFSLVWQKSQIKETRISIPQTVLDAMQDSVYGWRVTAVARDGKRIVSPFATFEVAR